MLRWLYARQFTVLPANKTKMYHDTTCETRRHTRCVHVRHDMLIYDFRFLGGTTIRSPTSGGPNLVPPEVLLFMGCLRALLRCLSLHCGRYALSTCRARGRTPLHCAINHSGVSFAIRHWQLDRHVRGRPLNPHWLADEDGKEFDKVHSISCSCKLLKSQLLVVRMIGTRHKKMA